MTTSGPNTKFSYQYRDANNDKMWGEVIFEGALRPDHEERLREALIGTNLFYHAAIDVPNVADWRQRHSWGGGQDESERDCNPRQVDEMSGSLHELLDLEPTDQDVTDDRGRTIEAFVREVEAVAQDGWSPPTPLEECGGAEAVEDAFRSDVANGHYMEAARVLAGFEDAIDTEALAGELAECCIGLQDASPRKLRWKRIQREGISRVADCLDLAAFFEAGRSDLVADVIDVLADRAVDLLALEELDAGQLATLLSLCQSSQARQELFRLAGEVEDEDVELPSPEQDATAQAPRTR